MLALVSAIAFFGFLLAPFIMWRMAAKDLHAMRTDRDEWFASTLEARRERDEWEQKVAKAEQVMQEVNKKLEAVREAVK